MLSLSCRRIWLIRHGSTLLNEAGVLLGIGEPGLSEIGREQVESLTSFLNGKGISGIVVSSPRLRALETAKILSVGLDLPDPVVSEGLSERSYGSYDGMDKNELDVARRKVGLSDADPTLIWKGVTGVEQDKDVVARVIDSLQDTLGSRSQRTESIVVVTHAGVIKSIVHHVLGVAEDRPYAFRFTLGGCVLLTDVYGYVEVSEVWANPKSGPRQM